MRERSRRSRSFGMSEQGAAVATQKAAGKVLIEARGISKDFADAGRVVNVLSNLDLTVRAGNDIAIVGQSGVGKSTLLYVLGTMETPTAGKVMFEGEDLFALEQAE